MAAEGDPVPVEDHSFFSMGPGMPLAIPYGVYDLGTDAGWVNVGVDHDTSAFAVDSIRRWWATAWTKGATCASIRSCTVAMSALIASIRRSI